MPLTTRRVTCSAHDAGGQPIPGLTVSARLVDDRGQPAAGRIPGAGQVLPTTIEATTDDDGVAVLTLVPTAVLLPDTLRHRIVVTGPSGVLADRIEATPDEDVTLAALVAGYGADRPRRAVPARVEGGSASTRRACHGARQGAVGDAPGGV